MVYIPAKVDSTQPVLEITPGDIKITLSTGKDHVVELKLKNLTTSSVAYKVKTTAPDKYQVRPIQSTILPGETAACMIVLKAMDKLPDPTDIKNLKHKFLIQSVIYDNETEIGQFWKAVETAKTEHQMQTFHDQRILCTLVVPDITTASSSSSSTSLPQSTSQPCNTNCEIQLAEKTKEFDGLMEFTLKQNTNIKALTAQLEQKTKETENLKRTITELEKATMSTKPTPVTKPVTPTENGTPMWALLVAFILGIMFHWLLLCSKCATPKA